MEVKKARLQEVIDLQHIQSKESNAKDVGKTFKVLIEGTSKRSEKDAYGRNSQYVTCIFPKGDHEIGTYVNVKITAYTTTTLIGEIV